MVAHFGAFLGVAVLVIVTPGPDTALTIRNSLFSGRRAGAFTALGVSCGQAIWAVAASAGLAAVLQASEPAFTALRLVGSAYLVFLGLQAFYRVVGRRRREGPGRSAARGGSTAAGALRQGLFSNLGNAKMAVFFTSLLPQFGTIFWTMFPLGLCFAALTFGWLTAYAIAVARVAAALRRPRIRRALDAFTGFVLVLFGLRIGTSNAGPV